MMTHEEAQALNIRMMCLSFAVNSGGDEDAILSRAAKYYAFVIAKKPDLRVVSINDNGDAA